MASLSNSGGNKTIQFVALDGKRRSIRLGKATLKAATTTKMHVENLLSSIIAQSSMPDVTARWLDELRETGSPLLEKLIKVGLVEGTAGSTKAIPTTLAAFLEYYRETLGPSVVEGTRVTWAQSAKFAIEFFGGDTPLRSISEGAVIEFQLWLRSRPHGRRKKGGLSESYIRRRCRGLGQVFSHGIALGILSKNPFLTKRVQRSEPQLPQKYFVSAGESSRIFELLPNAEWRALFSLARWGAARIPSEARNLKWSDVSWNSGRLVLRSPKTSRHAGHEQREIPLFVELRSALNELWEVTSEKGSPFVFPNLRNLNSAALRRSLVQAIEQAGLQPWSKLWTCLRASRDSELRSVFPDFICDKWVGHSGAIARRYYLQVRDSDYDRACSALHIPVQQPAASSSNGKQQATGGDLVSKALQFGAVSCFETAASAEIVHGFHSNSEKSLFCSVESLDPPRRAAQSGAVAHSGALSQAISLANSALPAAAAGEALAVLSQWLRDLAQLHNIEASIDSQSTLCQVVDALASCKALSRTQATQVDSVGQSLAECVYGAPRSSQSLVAVLESAAVLLSGK